MVRQRSAKNGAPLIVKVGSAVAKIYRDENRGGPRSTVAYYDATRRRRREFYTDLETAKTAANFVVTKLQNGNGVQNSPYKTAYNWRRAAMAGSS